MRQVDRPLRIAIATSGRFHVLDLARELAALGHQVRFHSMVPKSRCVAFGLPPACHVALSPRAWALMGWNRLRPRRLPGASDRLVYRVLNRDVIAGLQPCDMFIGMSGMVLEAAEHAKRVFGARIYLERGSRHILSQRDILVGIGAAGASGFTVERELAGYALADRIAVGSQHVVDSFLERDPALAAKLFKNAYGVHLDQFPLQPPAPAGGKTVLFVGGWTLRKGADVLTAAMEHLPGVRLIHVGGLGDVPFPRSDRFVHVDPVPQSQLPAFYAQANAFVIASREEGLAVVQAQALASGLPIVCTDRTGGADLAHTPALAARIKVVPHCDPHALASAIAATLASVPAVLPSHDREFLSWHNYAQRYARELQVSLA